MMQIDDNIKLEAQLSLEEIKLHWMQTGHYLLPELCKLL